jgi:hypothetical protein
VSAPIEPRGDFHDSEIAELDSKIGVLREITWRGYAAAEAQAIRLTSWLLLGNGASLAFTYNAVLSGAPGCATAALEPGTFFLVGIVAAFSAVSIGYLGQAVGTMTSMRLLQTSELERLIVIGSAPPQVIPTPLVRRWMLAGVAALSTSLLALSALALVGGLATPLLDGGDTLAACAKSVSRDATGPGHPSSVLPPPSATATENARRTGRVNQPVNRRPSNHLGD